MISKKGKRRFQYGGQSFFWFVRADNTNTRRIHILSEDKKVNLEYPLFDSEVPVTPSYIRYLLEEYWSKQDNSSLSGRKFEIAEEIVLEKSKNQRSKKKTK